MIPPVPVVQAAAADAEIDALIELDYHLRRATALLGTLRGTVAVVRRSIAAAPTEGDDPGRDGPEIARRRRALGLSQGELAGCAYVSRGYLADLEGGRRTAPDIIAHVHRLLDALSQGAQTDGAG